MGVAGRIDVHLLDEFALCRADGRVPLAGVAQRLVAFLAVRGACHRQLVASCLWSDSSERSARANLRTALWLVRQAAPGLVISDTSRLALASTPNVDLHAFYATSRKLIQAVRDDSRFQVVLPEVTEIRDRELLPGWYDEWLFADREHVRQFSMHALEALSSLYLARGLLAEALEAGLAAVAMEPLRESANAAVVRAHMAECNVVEAVRHYQKFRDELWDELGCVPSERLASSLRPSPGRIPAQSRPRMT